MASIMEALLTKIDIVDLIQETVPELRQSSRGYTGHCPLHDSGDPDSQTLWVTGDNQLFHCFSCGESGNALSWFAKLHNLAFYEAINRLCEKYNIDIGNNQSYQEERNLVKTFTGQALTLNKEVGRIAGYLKERGLDHQSIDTHMLGWDEYKQAISIPLIDIYGRIVGMAFRNMKSDPKYINVKNNDLYDKSAYLFNLVNARKLIKKTGRFWLVEGYMDAMSGQAQGEAVTAYCSANINKGHILEVRNSLRDLKNIEVIIAADSDEAGQSKIPKMREKFRKYFPKVNLRIAKYPEGCKDMNDVHMAGLSIADMETVGVDRFVLQQLLAKCKSPEEQYATAQDYIVTVPNELVKSDLAIYLSETWKKPLEKIEALLSVKADGKDVRLKDIAGFDESLADLTKMILGEKRGLGWSKIDYAMNSVRNEEILLLAGYSTSGKSTVALKIVANRIIRYQENVAIFSLEMSKGSVIEAIIMEVMEVNTFKLEELIRTDAGIELYQKVKSLVDKHLRIIDRSGIDVKEAMEYIELLNTEVFETPVNFVMFDHFHLIPDVEDNSVASDNANLLGTLVKQYKCNVLVLAQFNEASQGNIKAGKYKEPTMSDIKGANALKAIAHTILLVWRLYFSHMECSEIQRDEMKFITRLKIAKHRRGTRGGIYYDLEYNPHTTKMTERKELYRIG